MARLILSLDKQVLAEYNMTKERYTIGRLPDNDVRIDNPAVSGHHSLIINILNDSFLEDLNSTNGTYVNGKLIKKHALQHGDVITIGHHQLRFSDQQAAETEQDEFEKTMVIPTGQQNTEQLIKAEEAADRAVAATVSDEGREAEIAASVKLDPEETAALDDMPPMPRETVTSALDEMPSVSEETETAALYDKPLASEETETTALEDVPPVSRETDTTTLDDTPPSSRHIETTATQPAPKESEKAERISHEATAAGFDPATAPSALPLAKLQVLSGAFAGRELELTKALTTLGRPGVQVAAITRRAEGYYIVHVESGKEGDFPLVNGQVIGPQARKLADNDVVQLAGVKMGFFAA
jgi:pSer/pThr/pTyr-binding forkhead associated (FHA) protein